MKTIAVIPARYSSTRLPGKPLIDICGKPMIWWVYQQAKKVAGLDEVIVATENDIVVNTCKKYNMNYILTSSQHDTPTSRIYEVSTKTDYDYYAFISGDEPLIDTKSIEMVLSETKKGEAEIVNAMRKIYNISEALDPSNIKIVVNTEGYLMYVSRYAIPFPKGNLDIDYMKFVGIGVFSKKALEIYNNSPKSNLEKAEECDLIRFLDKNIKIKMVEIFAQSLSVDTTKDLEFVRKTLKETIISEEAW